METFENSKSGDGIINSLDTEKINLLNYKPIDTEKVKMSYSVMNLIKELQGNPNSTHVKGIEVLFKSDNHDLNGKTMLILYLNGFNELMDSNSEKSNVCIEKDIFDIPSSVKLSNMKITIQAIVSMDINSLMFLLNIGKYTEVLITSTPKTLTTDGHPIIRNNHDQIYLDMAAKNIVSENFVNLGSLYITERFTLLVNGNSAMLKEILKNPKLPNQLIFIDTGKFKLLFNILHGNYVSQIIENPPFIKSLISITCTSRSRLFMSKTLNRAFISSLLKHKKSADLIKSFDIFTLFTSLLKNGTLCKYIITKLSGENIVHRLDKLKLLLSNRYYREMISQLIILGNGFDIIDSIKIGRLKLLIFKDKLSSRSIENILNNQNAIVKINQIQKKKLKLLCQFLDCPMMLKILTNHSALKGISYIDFQKIKLLLNHQLYRNHIVLLKLLESQESVCILNFMKLTYFRYLLDRYNFPGLLLTKLLKGRGPTCIANIIISFGNNDDARISDMLKNSDVLDFVVSIDTEKLRLLLKHYKVFQFMDPNPQVINFFNTLDSGKLKILVNDGNFPYWTLQNFHRIFNFASVINSMDDDKLEYLVRKNYLTEVVLDRINMDIIHRLNIEKLDVLKVRPSVMNLLLRNETIIDAIVSFDTERLKLLTTSNELYLSVDSYTTVIEILQNNDACNLIHLMDIEKLKALSEGYNCIRLFNRIPKCQNTMNFLKFNNATIIRQLISLMKWVDIENISIRFNGDIRRNLNFSLLLLKNGDIEEIDWKFVCDSELINRTVTKVLISDDLTDNFPIDQVLVKSEYVDEVAISSLKNLSTMALMDESSDEDNEENEDNNGAKPMPVYNGSKCD